MFIHSDYDNLYPCDYDSYKGGDCIEIFVEELMAAYEDISKKLNYYKKSKAKLTTKQEKEFQEATHCCICKKESTDLIQEHNHLNGKYRGPACQSCNTKEGRDTKTIPVFIHNGSGYDFYFTVQEIVKYSSKYHKVEVLPKTKEDYISISIENKKKEN